MASRGSHDLPNFTVGQREDLRGVRERHRALPRGVETVKDVDEERYQLF